MCRICLCIDFFSVLILFIRLSFVRSNRVRFFLEHISIVHVSRIVVAIAPIAVFALFLYRNERKLKPHTKIISKSLVNRPRAVNIIVYLTQCLKSQKCSVYAYVYKCAEFFFAQLAFSLFFWPRLIRVNSCCVSFSLRSFVIACFIRSTSNSFLCEMNSRVRLME